MALARLAIILSFVVLALAAVFVFTMDRTPPQQAASQGEALIGGPFSLTNHKGEPVTDQTYAGKAMLIYFGFTFCPDVCPTELQKLSAALDQMGDADRAKLVPLFITIDPERDTAQAMADYVEHFHPDLIGLTGTAEQIKQAASAYRIFYSKEVDESSTAGYTMSHTNLIYFMGPDHRFVTVFHAQDGPDKIAREVTGALNGK